MSDFFSFPTPPDYGHLSYEERVPLPHSILSFINDIFKGILKKDQLVHFTCQEFGMVGNFVRSASESHTI